MENILEIIWEMGWRANNEDYGTASVMIGGLSQSVLGGYKLVVYIIGDGVKGKFFERGVRLVYFVNRRKGSSCRNPYHVSLFENPVLVSHWTVSTMVFDNRFSRRKLVDSDFARSLSTTC